MKVQRFMLEYHNNAQNSHKFYQVFILDKQVLIHYGRVGTAGTVAPHPTESREESESFAFKKVWEKRDKGYEEIEPPVVFEFNGSGAVDVHRLTSAMRSARDAGTIKSLTGDLTEKATELANEVAALVGKVKSGAADAGALLDAISSMEANVAAANEALENATVGLEMARLALGQRMQA